MAKKSGKLALRYATALRKAVDAELGTAGAPTPAQRVAEELTRFANAWKEQHELSNLILSPMFDRDERAAALRAVLDSSGAQAIVSRFLNVLFERDRLAAVEEISAAFSRVADDAAGIVQVSVTTATDIADDEKSEIQSSLAQLIEGTPSYSWSVEPELLGGMKVAYSGKVLDGSLAGKLEKIHHQLLRA